MVTQNLLHGTRAPKMIEIVKEFTTPIHALEIGSWYGVGSTNIWLEFLPEGSTLTLLDLWRPFANDGSDCVQMGDERNVPYDAFLSTINHIKSFELDEKMSKRNIKVNIVRGDSNPFLSYFNSNMFDFIYIDGDHSYKGSYYDMCEAKRLIKSNGIICGDDYDSPVSDSNIEELRKHIDNPKAPHHPGLSVAVYEAFGQVNNSNGFWWVYMKDGKPSLV